VKSFRGLEVCNFVTATNTVTLDFPDLISRNKILNFRLKTIGISLFETNKDGFCSLSMSSEGTEEN
jgi:hypothetical protein